MASMFLVNVLDLIGLSLFIPILDTLQDGSGFGHGVTRIFSRVLTFFGLAPSLFWFLVLLSVFVILKAAIMLWSRRLIVSLSSRVQHSLRMQLFEGYVDSTVSFVNDQRQGALLSALHDHTVRAGQVFFSFMQMILHWSTAVAYTAFVLVISWQLTLVAVVLGAFMYPVIRWIGSTSYSYSTRFTVAIEDAQHFALEMLQAKKLLNAAGWGPKHLESYKYLSGAVRSYWQGTAFWSNSPGIFVQPISVIVLSLLIFLSVQQDLSTSILGAFILAFIRLLPTVQSALTTGADLKAHLPSIERVEELLRFSKEAKEPNGRLEFKNFARSIVLENVHFSYRTSENRVFSGLSMTIQRGQTVALVGGSGSGKTTVADLILGLYPPTTGRILIDDTDLREIDLEQYRARIAYIPQDPVLFHQTIFNNLTIGLHERVEEAELEAACRKTGAWEFISQRPKGLETVIGDRGVQISGGQRQRLALARALLRKPELLLLDEATSALDDHSEMIIQETLEKLIDSGDYTIMIIAHRYTTIRGADVIYEIKDGKAVKLGNSNQGRRRLED